MGCRGRGRFPFPCISSVEACCRRQSMHRSGSAVEASQGKLGEVNGVPAIVDRLQSDAFSLQSFAYKYLVMLPGELSPCEHTPHRHRAVVFRFGQTRRIGTRRGRVAVGRGAHVQRLVRTLLVVLAAELIEATLPRA